MRCLTFSDLSLGGAFAGGCRGQQCVELSLPLLKRSRPDPTLAPTTNGLGTHWEKDGASEQEGVGARLIVRGLSFETNCSFRSVLRGSNGRS